jgi:hypothetical protein
VYHVQPPFRPRGTGFDEAFLAPQVQALIGAVSRHMSQRHNASLHRIFNMSHILPDVDRCLTDPTYSPIEGDIPAFNITAIPTCGTSHIMAWRSRIPCIKAKHTQLARL